MINSVKNFFKRFRQSPDAFIIPKRPPPNIKDGETIEVEVICPTCNSYWADATVVFGAPVGPDSFKVREDFKKWAQIKPGRPLLCPSCGFEYTNWAIKACVVTAMMRKRRDDAPLQGFKSFGIGDGSQ